MKEKNETKRSNFDNCAHIRRITLQGNCVTVVIINNEKSNWQRRQFIKWQEKGGDALVV
jgi:hypothetical protein